MKTVWSFKDEEILSECLFLTGMFQAYLLQLQVVQTLSVFGEKTTWEVTFDAILGLTEEIPWEDEEGTGCKKGFWWRKDWGKVWWLLLHPLAVSRFNLLISIFDSWLFWWSPAGLFSSPLLLSLVNDLKMESFFFFFQALMASPVTPEKETATPP